MNNDFRRMLFGNQGGFPLAQEDLEFLQESLSDNLGMLAVAACLGQSSVIFGNIPLHNGSTLNIASCYVLLNGAILSCPAQNIAGAAPGNFWMVPEPVTDTPLQFQDGSVRDTRESRTAKIIYADVQPSGGVRVADMKIYAQLLIDSLVKPITNPLVQTTTGHTQTIAANAQAISGLSQVVPTKVTNLATPWKPLVFKSPWIASTYEQSLYRINSIGNLEMRIVARTQQNSKTQELCTFQSEDKQFIFANFNTTNVFTILNAVDLNANFFRYTAAAFYLDEPTDSVFLGIAGQINWDTGLPTTGYYSVGDQITIFRN